MGVEGPRPSQLTQNTVPPPVTLPGKQTASEKTRTNHVKEHAGKHQESFLPTAQGAPPEISPPTEEMPPSSTSAMPAGEAFATAETSDPVSQEIALNGLTFIVLYQAYVKGKGNERSIA